MGMTHYMELMMGSWYLLVIFMALPMFLAECYVVSEILLLLKGENASNRLKTFNRLSAYASAVGITVLALIAAKYFTSVAEWRTWVDVTAAVSYVLALFPFIFVALIEAGVLAKGADKVKKGVLCVTAVVCYLILSHAAMVFGMFDPVQFGWTGSGHTMMNHTMPMNHGAMPMDHSMHGAHMNHAVPADAPQCPHMQQAPQCPHAMPPAGHHMMPDGQMMRNDDPSMKGMSDRAVEHAAPPCH